MINFRLINPQDKNLYEKFLKEPFLRGCEMSFANLSLWGEQKIAIKDDCMFFFSTFSKSFYPFPYCLTCEEQLKKAIEEIILDAKERGIDCEISSINEWSKEFLERNFKDRFEFTTNDGSYDYVYDINDLADLLGKKYHKKRNHLNNFKKAHPNYTVEEITKENKEQVITMVETWYRQKEVLGGGDFDYEKDFFTRAMQKYEELGFIGIVLKDGEEVLAVTFGSFFHSDVLDVHFEKARADVDGAYVAINNEFAKFVRENYPFIKYLDREEDMGLEGLRKAKQSYYPNHQVIKYKARLKENK